MYFKNRPVQNDEKIFASWQKFTKVKREKKLEEMARN